MEVLTRGNAGNAGAYELLHKVVQRVETFT